jgi:hypothetical protein
MSDKTRAQLCTWILMLFAGGFTGSFVEETFLPRETHGYWYLVTPVLLGVVGGLGLNSIKRLD